MGFKEKMKDLATGVKYVVRGIQGLPPDEDIFSGLIDVNDIKERTRLPSQHDVYGQEFMRLLAKYGEDEWGIYQEIADLDAHLLISLEGEQRKEAILMQRSKSQANIVMPGQALQIPQVSTKPEGKEEKKK